MGHLEEAQQQGDFGIHSQLFRDAGKLNLTAAVLSSQIACLGYRPFHGYTYQEPRNRFAGSHADARIYDGPRFPLYVIDNTCLNWRSACP